MKNILLEKKYALEYIKDIINDCKVGKSVVNNSKYHHNTNYEDASSICKYGILSLEDLNKLGIKNFPQEFLEKMDDIESHVNGKNGISLSIVGLQDIYPNEDVYDPYKPTQVDFLVSSDIQAFRSSIHYGNEYLSYNSISRDKLRAIDIRLLKLIELLENKNGNSLNEHSIQNIIQKYNSLKDIALTMKQYGLDIPFREMSYKDNFSMDIDKLSDTAVLKLK